MSTIDHQTSGNGEEKTPMEIARLIEEATSNVDDDMLTPEEENLLLKAQSTVMRVENSLRRHITYRCPYCDKPISVPTGDGPDKLLNNIRRHIKMTKGSVHGGGQGKTPAGFDGRMEEGKERVYKAMEHIEEG